MNGRTKTGRNWIRDRENEKDNLILKLDSGVGFGVSQKGRVCLEYLRNISSPKYWKKNEIIFYVYENEKIRDKIQEEGKPKQRLTTNRKKTRK